MEKILLVSDIPPSTETSDSILTWHLCKNFSNKSLIAYFLVDSQQKPKIEFPFSPAPKVVIVDKPDDRTYRPGRIPKPLRFLSSYLREMKRKYIEIPALGRQIQKLAKENQTEKVWIVLHGQTMIWLAEYLIRKTELSVHVQVRHSLIWDVRKNLLDRFAYQALKRSYEFCVRSCASLGTPSPEMSRMVQEKWKKESYPLTEIACSNRPPSEDNPSSNRNKFVIGLPGGIYNPKSFDCFIEALDQVYWELEGKIVEIYYWGLGAIEINRSRIINRGQLGQESFMKDLSQCDVIYCPYWFSQRFLEESKVVLPDKIVSALSSGRPILYHGLPDSAPGVLLNKNGAAICFSSEDAEIILFNLRKALFSAETKETVLKNAASLVRDDLSQERIFSKFRKFLDIEKGAAV